jgi:hypothetical protein
MTESNNQLGEFVEQITELLDSLKGQVTTFLNRILSSFNLQGQADSLSPAQQERVALAVEVESGLDLEFSDQTNPLTEQGEENLSNIQRIPTESLDLPAYNRESGEPKNSWVESNGEKFWCDHQGFIVSIPYVKFFLRDGYNPTQHGNLEQYMEQRVVQGSFMGVPINGGVHPILLNKLRNVELEMNRRGISYAKDGTNTIDRIDGFAYRAIGADGKGQLSLHSLLAIDFSKNRNNQLVHIPGDNFADYMNSVDYSEDFYNLMRENSFRGFMDWVANGRGERDTMQFDLPPNPDGTLN